MSEEKHQKAYDSINTDVIAEKMSEAMLQLLRGSFKEDGAGLFGHIKDSLTHDEAVYLSSVHVAQMVKKMLETNPIVGMMAAMVRNASKDGDEKGGEELLKKFKDILDKKP